MTRKNTHIMGGQTTKYAPMRKMNEKKVSASEKAHFIGSRERRHA